MIMIQLLRRNEENHENSQPMLLVSWPEFPRGTWHVRSYTRPQL